MQMSAYLLKIYLLFQVGTDIIDVSYYFKGEKEYENRF